ncbi:glycosyltransferase family 2 protein [Candidatus Saccharibacteria bacterium]|nr:glycosyltransferase family 2 protein [Candidatus Saccharibacteria bacterium]MBH1972775.1 glycosyltransferase family 2 protein [Candidatus Saccharibacteria bacterium]MBH1990976.1 glycosyltransferase family 2 protein [Candidatus Saccharibacteria bacterium]
MSGTVAIRPVEPRSSQEMKLVEGVIDLVKMSDGVYALEGSKTPHVRVPPFPQTKLRLHEIRKSIGKVRLFRKNREDSEARPARIVAIIPAHDEETSIAKAIESLLLSTRQIDKLVVMVNNSTDNTAAIARDYAKVFPDGQIEVLDEQGMLHGKVGALGYAWSRYVRESEYDFVFFVDADVECESDALEQLERSLIDKPRAAGIRASYTFHLPKEASGVERRMILAQRHEFAEVEIRDQMRGSRTHILGGQATLFRASALAQVAARTEGSIPWNRKSRVEDSELSIRLRQMGYETLVNPRARAYVGPMVTPHALRSQRIKWTNGHISDAVRDREWLSPFAHVHVWRQQISMVWNLAIRLLFIGLLLSSATLHMFVFVPLWLAPTMLSIIFNVLVAYKIPGRSSGEILRSWLFFPDEIALWRTLSVWLTSWAMIALSAIGVNESDLWAKQRQAEANKKVATVGAWFGMLLLVLAGYALVMLVNGIFGLDAASVVIRTGWSVATLMTIISCCVLLGGTLRLLAHYRKLSL